jgi:hypothetical protein
MPLPILRGRLLAELGRPEVRSIPAYGFNKMGENPKERRHVADDFDDNKCRLLRVIDKSQHSGTGLGCGTGKGGNTGCRSTANMKLALHDRSD